MSAKEGCILGDILGVGYLPKEGLHFPSRSKSDQHSTWIFTHIGPGMRYLSWRQDGIASLQPHLFLSQLNENFAFDHIEPLVLIMMQVPGRTALSQVAVFDHEQPAFGILRGNFEFDRSKTEWV